MASKIKRIVDKKWEQIFNDYPIVSEIDNNGRYIIEAKTIKKYREPRLMTKFDFENTLPQVFIDNDITVLPLSKREYILGRFETYHKISENFHSNIKSVEFPAKIETLDHSNITSETNMFNALLISGAISDFINETEMWATVNGKMTAGKFNFQIKDKYTNELQQINVNGTQIEIDGGIETAEALYLFELKNDTTDSFLVRQLYYPFRTWYNRLDPRRKEIRTIFIRHKKGVYNISAFRFENPNEYSSIQLLHEKNYRIKDETIYFTKNEIHDILNNTATIPEPNPKDMTIPQADSIDRLLKTLTYINNAADIVNLEDIAVENDFTGRQALYYATALRYLGLVTKQGNEISLTSLGQQIAISPLKEQRRLFIVQMVKHEPMRELIKTRLNKGGKLTKLEAGNAIKPYVKGISGETVYRRAQTIHSWTHDLMSNK